MSLFHAKCSVSMSFLLIFGKVFELGMEITKTLFKVLFLAKENTGEMSKAKSKTLIYFFYYLSSFISIHFVLNK